MKRLVGLFVSLALFFIPSFAHAFNLAGEGYSGFYLNPTYHVADSKVKLGEAAWQKIGLPALGFHWASLAGEDFDKGGLGDGDLLWFNITEGLFDRLEVGYSYLVFDHDTGWVMTPSLDKNFHIFIQSWPWSRKASLQARCLASASATSTGRLTAAEDT